MRKMIGILILLMLVITGCNMPSQVSTPSGEEIATRVAFELTALPSSTLPPTQAPSLTPEPSQTPMLEPSVTATETVAAPSATPVPGDPRLTLGDPSWKETFSSGKTFGLSSEGYDDEQTQFKIENDALVLVSKNAMGFHGWRTGGPVSPDHAYIEGTFQVASCSGRDEYGLVFRSGDYIDGYWFIVTCSGNYQFGYWKDNQFTGLFSGTESQHALLTGGNQTNRLGVKTEGNQFSLYANGTLLQQVTDSTFEDGGHVGAVIGGAETINFTVRLDEIAYWNLH